MCKQVVRVPDEDLGRGRVDLVAFGASCFTSSAMLSGVPITVNATAAVVVSPTLSVATTVNVCGPSESSVRS